MRTAVVILNWNTKDFLAKFLPPLLSSMPEGAEVIVADSASTDGSMEMMDADFPQVRKVRLDGNYGFTGGYNRAFKAVCALEDARDLEYLVLINSDIEVSDG
ncbi:MAG: glycosyltransferase, partial [Bacteroidales bacterium]|nr:glycosyltransferase [Candidatus Cryptobacteroides faecihippi]